MLGIFLLLTYIFIVDVASASLSSTVVGSVRDHFCDGGAWGSDKVISTSTRINRLSSDQECADYCGRVIYERGFYNSGDVIRHYVSNRNVGTDRKCFCHILEFTTNNHCELAGNHAPNTYYDILYVDTVVSADLQYDLFTSGTCTSNGAVEPSSQAECEAAAIQLGLGDGGGDYGELGYAGAWTGNPRPRCCYYPNLDQKVRYIISDDKVSEASSSYQAICRVVPASTCEGSSKWTQLSGDIDGEAAGDNSGWSVSLSSDGSVMAIGAMFNDGTSNDAGHVRVYEKVGYAWTQLGGDIDGEAASDWSGYSVSLSSDGSIVAIGAYGNDGTASNAGHVRVYSYSSGTWTQLGVDIEGEYGGGYAGYSVSLSADGSVVAVGEIQNGDNGAFSGQVRMFSYSGGVWTKLGQDLVGSAGDKSGESVSLSADGLMVAIGSRYNDGGGANAGRVRV